MNALKKVALPILMIPLLGASTCTEEKLVALSVGFPTTATFVASGGTNWHEDTDIVDVKENLDIEEQLSKLGLTPAEVEDDALTVILVEYRIIKADPVASRRIVNGQLTVWQVDDLDQQVGPVITAVDGFVADAGAVTDWIDITSYLTGNGLDFYNTYLMNCLKEAKGTYTGPPIPSRFAYKVEGVSTPPQQDTNFTWEFKITFQGKFNQTYDVPFGN